MEKRMRWLSSSIKSFEGCFLITLLHFSAAAFTVHGQRSTQSRGFIFIDCGISDSNYRDSITGITYVSDEQFTDTGINRQVSDGYIVNIATRYKTVRSFPDGNRNCYFFSTIAPGMKYVIRATFLYGNYDLQDIMPQFDLYLDANLWRTINITDPSQHYIHEVVTEATSDHISVCLVNTGHGTPFISGLDLRQMNASLYPMVTASRSLVLSKRLNMAGARDVRYPVDPYDRLWLPYASPTLWNNITTNSTIQNAKSDQFQVPALVMTTAVSPANSTKLELITSPGDSGDLNETFAVMYFSELQSISQNASRQFFIFFNNVLLNDAKSFTPEFLKSHSIYNMDPSAGFNITLAQTSDSALPPILNAVEVFTAMRNTSIASDGRDVDAMMEIKELYPVQENWNGDPCAPKAYMWQGLNCTPDASGTPRITTVNLSNSGLTGEISTYFAALSSLQYLDLSHNNLTGPMPEGLAYLPLLKLLDLTDNQLNGSVPSAILKRLQNGSLTLRTEGNQNLCFDNACEAKHTSRGKKSTQVLTIIIASIVPSIIIFSLAAITIYIFRRRQGATRTGRTKRPQNEGALQFENKRFTYMDLERITNSFERILGSGGFGTVYYGHLEDGTEVAVKMPIQASTQRNTEFVAEIQHLTRVHHKNLVSMVGYCNDRDRLALVYEFMSQGTLKKYLKGSSSVTTLSWRQRLQIALGAAQGLEYLHSGCKPPLIHRDVKSENILLNEKMDAKISDFGLSKAFQNDSHTHVSTRVVGTPGYLDPEYYIKNKLTKKSDVFSYGVVLLELVTGQPPILDDAEGSHIIDWVRQRLAKGNIEDVVDSRLNQDYDVNSSWKVASLGLECVAQSSQERPTMTEVVIRLKETLELYDGGDGTLFQRNLNSEKLHAESSEISQIDAHEIQDATSVWVSDGPSVR